MKYLLPNSGRFYKACLHTHSTVSDGKMPPEEVKERYKSKGYSILALTDHEICFDHPELNDENFLTLTSYEMMTYDENPRMTSKTYHLNLIAKDPTTDAIVFVDRDAQGVMDGKLEGNIENYKGTILPETSAKGTAMLITMGAMLVTVAAVFMVTRKKMSIYED